ncbi:hypothetical protein IGI04_034953 [Brassica rapa subsp. trilocularis]|uniref:DUF287 domain-containing protein n=1 Tax=Brassica rapa subsp. trilocularis TaxID=1813537 RepID=A0ABQ7LA98_BRACM|nr:hypothetical protein IGI04_034953 [Brassica rapa subsp. trilocularis]
MKGNQKGDANERRHQSLRIRKPDSIAKKPEPRVHKSSKKTKKSRSKKSRPVGEPVRAPSVESLSASDESEREGSERERGIYFVINSVLVPTIGEQIMLARIIDEEGEYDRQGSPNQAARGVLPKKKDKEKVTFAEGSSSNSGLDSRLQGMEERILEFMGEGFVGLHVTMETKLESLGSRMSDIEKNQRLLRRRTKKIEDMLTSIESKMEPMGLLLLEERESEIREQEKEKSETDEVEFEAREAEIEKGTPTEGTPKYDHNESRVETNITDETLTPPRGRTKAMAARRLMTRPMEEEPEKCEKVVEEEKKKGEAVETEEKITEKVAEEEKKEEEAGESCGRRKKKEEETVKVVEEQTGEVVKEQAGEVFEEYTEEEKQRWIMVVYKEAPSLWIMHRCKENAAVAVPKKSGRPKRKSQWVWKNKFTSVTIPKNE